MPRNSKSTQKRQQCHDTVHQSVIASQDEAGGRDPPPGARLIRLSAVVAIVRDRDDRIIVIVLVREPVLSANLCVAARRLVTTQSLIHVVNGDALLRHPVGGLYQRSLCSCGMSYPGQSLGPSEAALEASLLLAPSCAALRPAAHAPVPQPGCDCQEEKSPKPVAQGPDVNVEGVDPSCFVGANVVARGDAKLSVVSVADLHVGVQDHDVVKG